MKKLILVLGLLLCSFSYAQPKEHDSYCAVIGGFDLRNATFGSQPTHYKPALDWTLKLAAVGHDFEMNVEYEKFNYTFIENKMEIRSFEKMSLGIGYHFPLYAYIGHSEIKTTFIPTIEPSMITRRYKDLDPTSNGIPPFLTLGATLTFQWDISDRFAFQLASNFLPRPDLAWLYGHNTIVMSNYGKLVYKLTKEN